MTRETLSNVDTALLRLEDPTNLMMVTAFMILGSPLDPERLHATIQARLVRIRRFRQRVVWPRLGGGKPYWEDDPEFDLDYHVRRVGLPPPGGKAALQDIVSLLASTPLDLSRPPWQFHLIETYGKGSALIWRLHHCIGDGMALAQVLLSITDEDADPPWPLVQPARPDGQDRYQLAAFLQPAQSWLRAATRTGSLVKREGLGVLADSSRVVDLGRTARDGVTVVGRLAGLQPDPKTTFRGKLGVAKRAAWSAAVPLDQVETIRRGLGGTLNDVLIAAMAGALGRYLQGQGRPVDQLCIRAVVPVNLRPPRSEGELGNRMGAVILSLPVGIADPVDRLQEIERRMQDRKDSMEARVFYLLLGALGATPSSAANALVSTFGNRATVLMTNVPGPREARYLAGTPIDALMGWVPKTGRLGIGVSILSYAGQVRSGVITDEGLVPDPERIIAMFHDEFEALVARSRLAQATATVREDSEKNGKGRTSPQE